MPLHELEKVKLVELVCSHNIHCQAIKKPGVCRMDGIGYLLKKFKLPKNVFFSQNVLFHCFISVFILFVFLLLRFYDCGSSYAPASGNKTLHGPMLLESRLFCSHVLRSLCFFLTINCVVRLLKFARITLD